jgi:hypothetical protein
MRSRPLAFFSKLVECSALRWPTTKQLTCGKCNEGWICEEHPDLAWPHENCAGPGIPCDVPTCPDRIDLRPVKTRTGLVCPLCRLPVATIEDEGAGTIIFPLPGDASIAGQGITQPRACIRGTRRSRSIVFLCPACGRHRSAEEPGVPTQALQATMPRMTAQTRGRGSRKAVRARIKSGYLRKLCHVGTGCEDRQANVCCGCGRGLCLAAGGE